ncbi:MAG: DoxX family protein [Myxococcales bacterium]|nr:DoxX family protein [Myxococcales bacterium]
MARGAPGRYASPMRAFLERLRPFSPLVLRLAVAAIFCVYGARVVFREMAQFQVAVAGWHLPRWFGFAAAWSALVGGGLCGIGFLTRPAALLCATFAGFMLWKTKLHAGWQGGLDLPVLAIAACVALLLSGAGRLSLDRRLFGGP